MENKNQTPLQKIYVFTVRGHIVANCTADHLDITSCTIESTLRFAWKHEFKRTRSVVYGKDVKYIYFSYE